MKAAGYSGTPLAKKLGIKAGARVGLVQPPPGFEALLEPLPTGVRFETEDAVDLDVLVYFATRRDDFFERFPAESRRIAANGGIWAAWPKRTSGVESDLSDGVVREFGLATGLVDNKVCAISDVWSGLRFVVRVENRNEWKSRPGCNLGPIRKISD